MAEDMIERAAKAIWETWSERVRWDERREFHKDETRKEARAALLAALDPEDEALVLHLAKHIRYATPGDEDFDISRARAAVDALKRLAQGGSEP